MIQTYNEYHLGDQLIHLNYLRRLSYLYPDYIFRHYCQDIYIPQLLAVVEDLTTIEILPLGEKVDSATNAWLGVDGWFYRHPKQRHWVDLHLDWFDTLSKRLGVKNPIRTKYDLFFEYPALRKKVYQPFDVLIINCPPGSNQLPTFSPGKFESLTKLLCKDMDVMTVYPTKLCPSTLEMHMTVTEIGNLAQYCQYIVAVDTGPLWTTYNQWNMDKIRGRTIYTTTFDSIDLTPNTDILQKI
jgi:hypothetical protein